jgi:tetratricopeptide (TPR) repeat protein
LARRVALITNAPLAEAAEGLSSPLSSVRREIILTARALEAQGVAVQVLSLRSWPREQVRAVVEKAERVVFGAMQDERDEAAYRDAVTLCGAARRLVFFIGERDAPRRFYREVAPCSHAWLARSESSRKALEPECDCKVLVAPLPAESERRVPHVPRRGLRSRAGTTLAKRAGVGLDPWRLRLLWPGTATTAHKLREALPALRGFAARVPLFLHCLTDAEDLLAPEGAPSSVLRIVVERASPRAMAAALAACDVVVLPDHETFIDALNAGRFVIPQPDAAQESLAAGLDWLLRHPGAALERLQENQRYVMRNHSPAAISRFWMRLLDFAGSEEAAPLVSQARTEYAAGRPEQAERLLGTALELDSALPEGQHLLGNIYQDQGKADRAISCYRRALRLDADSAAAHNDLGTAYVAKGWYAEAVDCYLEAVRLDAGNEAAQTNLAQTLLKTGRRREALPHFTAALRLRLRQLLRRMLKINSRRSMP